MKKLKTLDEFQEEKQRLFIEAHKLNKSHPNGIACPKCGEELWDTSPMVSLMSNPPQKNIHCPKCEYKGFRLE